ncbi:MAG: hypothetical protein GXC76_14210 [Rhodanobacteraceae bacterium]|jgi:hypothetical protein|nr:hypothetical protein [Rhodanobacteraceae bacterium]
MPAPVRTCALPLLIAAALAACSPSQPPAPAAPAAAPAVDPQLAKALDLYRKLQQEQSWELAAPIGEEIVTKYPDSAAAREVQETLADSRAKADAIVTRRRLAQLWIYQTGKESGGDQTSASIYSSDAAPAARVRLVLRRHSDWGQSVYLFGSGKGFECRATCTLAARFDDQPVKLKAYLPPTGEPAMFISDDKAFLARLAGTQKLSIDVTEKDKGPHTLVFEVGGFDPAKFPQLAKKKK